jgi:hypothetical protein
MALKNLRDIVPHYVVEASANKAKCNYSGLRSHPQGGAAPIKLAAAFEGTHERKTTVQSKDNVPASRIKARVWVGGGGNASDDAGPVMASVFLNMPAARRRRGFSHFIYKANGKRIPIFK